MKAVCEGLNVSERRACKVLGQYRPTQRHVAVVKSDEDTLTSAIVELATQYGRYGYKRVTGLLREAGWRVNKKRVERIWRREGLKVPARAAETGSAVVQRRFLRSPPAGIYEPRVGVRLRGRPDVRRQGVPDAHGDRRVHPGVPGHRRGEEDQFQRCSLHLGGSVHPPWDSRHTSGPTTGRSSVPRRSASGSGDWAWERCSSSRAVLGRTEYIESFNGKLRDELLNREIFYTLKEARVLIEQWRRHYNRVRPHSALGYRPPAPETIAFPFIGLPSPWNSLETPGGFLH